MTAPERKAPGACNTKGLENHSDATILGATSEQVNVVDFSTERRAKDTATLIAQFALAGHTVHRSDTGDFLVCRYGHSRWCENLDALRAFAVRVGVRHE